MARGHFLESKLFVDANKVFLHGRVCVINCLFKWTVSTCHSKKFWQNYVHGFHQLAPSWIWKFKLQKWLSLNLLLSFALEFAFANFTNMIFFGKTKFLVPHVAHVERRNRQWKKVSKFFTKSQLNPPPLPPTYPHTHSSLKNGCHVFLTNVIFVGALFFFCSTLILVEGFDVGVSVPNLQCSRCNLCSFFFFLRHAIILFYNFFYGSNPQKFLKKQKVK